MRILVTGGTGFTGTHLVRRLLEKGHQVVCVDNQKGRSHDELVEKGAEVTIASVTERDLMEQLTRGCQRVYHLAAAFRKVNLGKKAYWDINVNATRHLLEAAYKHNVERFVYCSTCGVHGDVKNPPAGEDAPITPEDYYQYTKYEGEVVAQEYIEKGMWVSIVRPAAIYGPGDPERFYMLYKRVQSGKFIFLGDGSATYHPLYISNLIDALELASEADEARGQAYLIADERYVPIKELVLGIAKALDVDLKIRHFPFWPVYAAAFCCEMLYKPLPFEPPLFRRRVDWFRQNRAFDISKAKRELGYVPRVDLPTGLALTAEWYKEEGYLK
jgi:nucleoside-diphosphate-sugar epimerase